MYSLFGSLIINYMYKSFQFAKLDNFIISQMAKILIFGQMCKN